MRAARLLGADRVEITQVDLPAPAPGEVQVRVHTATTCGTDLKVFHRGGHARMLKVPCLFGHEGAGEVCEVGAGVSGFAVGERVVWNNSAPCGACFYCEKGEPSLCEDLLFLNGTYAERINIPARIVQKNLLHIPEGLSYDLAAMCEPLACVLHGAEKIGITAGETTVLLGDGGIGLMFVTAARFAGADILVIGGSDRRLEVARRLGAKATLNRHAGVDARSWLAEQTGNAHGADVVIEAVGRPEAWNDAVGFARKGGRVLLFGGCARDTSVTFDTERLHYDAITLMGVFHNTPRHVREALKVLSGPGGESLRALLDVPMGLEQLSRAFARMDAREALKVPIRPQPQ